MSTIKNPKRNRKELNVKSVITDKKLDLTKKVADSILKGDSSFSQVVLRRAVAGINPRVPFLAYTMEKDGVVRVLPVEQGSSSRVIQIESGDILSLSDGRKKVAKLKGN